MTPAARRLEVQKVVGYALIALILVGLIFLVHWVMTEGQRPRYPGIEKLRGESAPLVVPGALASTTATGNRKTDWRAQHPSTYAAAYQLPG